MYDTHYTRCPFCPIVGTDDTWLERECDTTHKSFLPTRPRYPPKCQSPVLFLYYKNKRKEISKCLLKLH